jgi:cysteine desulfurase
MIYLDYQATTPVAPEVAEAMWPWIEEKFANPHSPSRWGREAAAAIEVARKQVEQVIGLSGGRLAFTGSATEALNWALTGTMEKAAPSRRRIVTVG